MDRIMTIYAARKATKEVLNEFMPMGSLIETYCASGQKIGLNKYLFLANMAIEDARQEKTFIEKFQYEYDIIDKHLFRPANIKKCALDLAKEFHLEVQ